MTDVVLRLVAVTSPYCLGAIFLFAGVDKLLHYSGFVRALDHYVLIPPGTGRYLALFVIVVEGMLGVGLVTSHYRRCAAAAAAAVLILFAVMVGVNSYLRPSAECACWFTITLSAGALQHVLLNLLLAGIAVTLVADYPSLRPVEPTEP